MNFYDESHRLLYIHDTTCLFKHKPPRKILNILHSKRTQCISWITDAYRKCTVFASMRRYKIFHAQTTYKNLKYSCSTHNSRIYEATTSFSCSMNLQKSCTFYMHKRIDRSYEWQFAAERTLITSRNLQEFSGSNSQQKSLICLHTQKSMHIMDIIFLLKKHTIHIDEGNTSNINKLQFLPKCIVRLYQ